MMGICSKIAFIPIRIFCITLLILQMGIIDVYLATYINDKWLAFIAGDIIVIFLFIIGMLHFCFVPSFACIFLSSYLVFSFYNEYGKTLNSYVDNKSLSPL